MSGAATSALDARTAGAAPGRAAAAGVACTHCGLDVPAGLVEPGDGHQFCCGGCRMVYAAIHECGLDRYYELREAARPPGPARPAGGSAAAFDEPVFRAEHVTIAPDGLSHVELYLEGIHCAACVWLVERLPAVVPGVVAARLDVRRRTVRVAWDDARVPLSRVTATLASLGYPAHAARGVAQEAARRREQRGHVARIGVAGACAGNAMLVAFALYGGMFSTMGAAERTLLRATGFALAAVALLGPGRVFLRGALSSLRTRVLHMDVPVAIALTAGVAWGGLNVLRGTGEVYFESLTAVIFLLLVGRWIQFRQQRGAHDAIAALFAITPRRARRVEDDGGVTDVAADGLAAGETVEVRAGDTVPADGVIAEGASAFDRALLTGESRPVRAGVGDAVHAGTVNLTAGVRMTVTASGDETRVGRLLRTVERLAADRPPVVRLADRVAHVFVVVVLALAAATFVLWLRAGTGRALEQSIALLIVTCPCALGLATPLAVVAAIGRAARREILVKGGSVLEPLARPGLLLLDKTGTLTLGRTALVTWTGDVALRPLVAALERTVAHPVAEAFVRDADERETEDDAPAPVVADVAHVPGRGVRGVVDGRRLAVGTPSFVGEHAAPAPPDLAEAVAACRARGLSPVVIAADGAVVAVAGFGDPVRPEAKDALAALRAAGWRIGVLSGDDPAIVASVAATLGLDPAACAGGLTPEAKAERVREARAAAGDGATIVMVGDGANDVAAFAAATVGVAVHGGAEASLEASDVFLRRPGLEPVVALVGGAGRTLRVIRRCLVASLAYNALAGGLAVAGLINPLVAAILMPISSITVVSIAYRSRTFD